MGEQGHVPGLHRLAAETTKSFIDETRKPVEEALSKLGL